jgi:hypothetical protein
MKLTEQGQSESWHTMLLLLNHLYCLEREAIEATVGDDVPSDSETGSN